MTHNYCYCKKTAEFVHKLSPRTHLPGRRRRSSFGWRLSFCGIWFLVKGTTRLYPLTAVRKLSSVVHYLFYYVFTTRASLTRTCTPVGTAFPPSVFLLRRPATFPECYSCPRVQNRCGKKKTKRFHSAIKKNVKKTRIIV